MKKISVVITTYNEEENVMPLAYELEKMFESSLPEYDYDLIFMDNCSTDQTKVYIEQLCVENAKIKAIFNARNVGSLKSGFYGMLQAEGDCVVKLCADFQDPIEMIPKFVEEWENGFKIVCAIKTSSMENPIMRLIRTCYYKLIKKMSDVEQIEHFTGFALYDQSFIEILRQLDEPTPFLRGIVAELGFKRKDLSYTQPKRRSGKSHYSWYALYDTAMLSFTSYTKVGLRLATLLGFLFSAISILVALVYFVLKLLFWNYFPMGMAPLLMGVFILGSLQMFFIGLIGEYIMSVNSRIMKRPLVIVDKKINFEKTEEILSK